MKKWIVFKGFHFSTFIPKIKLVKDQISQSYKIKFTDSCKYNISEDSCVNKLFGHCFGIFQVHKNSVRFGWTYDESINKIIIWIYIYKDSKLTKFKIYECDFSVEYEFSIRTSITEQRTYFSIEGTKMHYADVNIPSKIIPTLGLYFGGNTRAPHKIYINYRNLDGK